MPLTEAEKCVMRVLRVAAMPPSAVVKKVTSTGIDPADVKDAIWHLIDVQYVELTPDLILKARAKEAREPAVT